MSIGELSGYITSLLVYMTFYMKTIMPLRVIAIASNVAFITYASIEGLVPVFILHTALRPGRYAPPVRAARPRDGRPGRNPLRTCPIGV